MIAIVQVLCVQGHRAREGHLLIHGGLETTANLTRGIHLRTHNRVISHVGTYTYSHGRHGVIGVKLAESREAGVLVQLIIHAQIELLEQIVASAAHQQVVIAVGESKVGSHRTRVGTGGLETEHDVLVLE